MSLLKVELLGSFPVSPNDGDPRPMTEYVAWENEQKIDKTTEIFFFEKYSMSL